MICHFDFFSFCFIIDPTIFVHRSKNDKRDLVAEYKKREGGKDMMNLVVIGMLDFMLSEISESILSCTYMTYPF